ncbi:MAG: hypothetical protein IIV73_02270, partial [Bacteroidaceae bacterium]|nr:hypothetical protein [Bacteroidaceae bacterium]
KKSAPELQFMANNSTLKRIEALKESAPEKAKKLLELGKEASRLRAAKGIDVESAAVKKPLLSRVARTILTLVTLPYTLPVSLLASPIFLLCEFLFTKLRDRAFRNSLRYLVTLFVWPLLVLIYAIIAFSVLPWQCALLTALFIMPAPFVAHEVWKTARLLVSDAKLMSDKRLVKIYSQIREILK